MKLIATQILKRSQLVFLFLFFLCDLFSQQSAKNKTERFGFMFSLDLAYNTRDKVLNPCLARKWSIGFTFTNKERSFLAFAGAGFKGFKVNLYSATFTKPFIEDLRKNYVPGNSTGEDSIIERKMYNNPGDDLYGTYVGHFELGLILNKYKFKPCFSLYVGKERYCMFDDGLAIYQDPEHLDIRYVEMSTRFLEFKLGCAIPIKKLVDKPVSFNINLGYKLISYGNMQFDDTPMSVYTNSYMQNKYQFGSKLTASLSFIFWTNWDD